ncbi:ATPase, partial [Butyricicoccus sp. 1XD8-22]
GVFDQSSVGLVIAGEPKLEVQIKTYLARMANRVDFYAQLDGLSPSEVEEYLGEFDIMPDALLEFKARACNRQTGCFRLLDRTLSNVRRILEGRESQTITPKIIEQASAMMML